MTTPTTSAAHPDDRALERGTVIHLAADQSMACVDVDDETWRRRAEVPEFQDGRVLSVFDYVAPWTYWERHPVGVELVHVLSGSVVFHLDDGRGRRAGRPGGRAEPARPRRRLASGGHRPAGVDALRHADTGADRAPAGVTGPDAR